MTPAAEGIVEFATAQRIAGEIYSEADDYRYAAHQDLTVSIVPRSVPDKIASRCRDLCAALGLLVAGIDLRRTSDGEWYCFEANPSPGFSFYERSDGATDRSGTGRALNVLIGSVREVIHVARAGRRVQGHGDALLAGLVGQHPRVRDEQLNAASNFGSQDRGGDAGGAQLSARVFKIMTALAIDHFVRASMVGVYQIAQGLGPIRLCLNRPAHNAFCQLA